MRMPLIIIAGPTAGGKTAAAVKLARANGGEVVTADSMQVYRGMDIGTAKPALEERGGVPHHMIDVAEPTEAFSVAKYQKMAEAVIADIHARGKTPILSGGTGFYINAVLYGNDFEERAEFFHHAAFPRQAAGINAEEQPAFLGQDAGISSEEQSHQDTEHNYGLLQQYDPEYAAAVHPNNAKRVARALDFYLATGTRLSEHNRAQQQNLPRYDARFFVIDVPRAELYARINARVLNMFERGLADEVRGLMDAGCHTGLTSMQGIGYKETAAYVRGETSREAAVQAIQQNTRHYAKRQVTWFKHRAQGAEWVSSDEVKI